MNLVFVYGSLKKGFHNHFILGDDSRFVGPDRAPGIMYDLGSFPGAIYAGTQMMRGEVYIVTDEILGRLDQLENHPYMYKREFIPLESGNKAWIYYYRRSLGARPPVTSGEWRR